MSVKITFYLDFLDDKNITQIDEYTVLSNFEGYYPKFQTLERTVLEGMVIIKKSDDNEIKIIDDLWVIVHHLFFSSISSLIAKNEECFLYRYQSQDTHLVLAPSGGHIVIFGEDCDNVPSIWFAKDELVLAFYECAQRFLNLLRRLKEAGESRFSLPHLEVEAEKARKVLEGHKLL